MRPQLCFALVWLVHSCTICHRWLHTGIVHLSLQGDGKVAFEDIPVFGVNIYNTLPILKYARLTATIVKLEMAARYQVGSEWYKASYESTW